MFRYITYEGRRARIFGMIMIPICLLVGVGAILAGRLPLGLLFLAGGTWELLQFVFQSEYTVRVS